MKFLTSKTRQSALAAAIALAAMLAACSGASFEQQAEKAVHQHMQPQIKGLEEALGVRLEIDDFALGECVDAGEQRRCGVSLTLAGVGPDGEVLDPERVDGEAVFQNSDGQWVVTHLD